LVDCLDLGEVQPRMSKGEALIQMLLSKAHNGDSRAKALNDKILVTNLASFLCRFSEVR
jgi:hypothetical protein